MPQPSDFQLKPPASVGKIAEFLVDVKGRQTLGGKFDIAEVWDQHDISVTHIDGFLNWLHVDRNDAPPKEMVLEKPPEQSLVKKPPVAEEDPEGAAAGLVGEGSEEPAINIHLWNALFKEQPRRQRRQMPQAASPSLGNRAANFANGYNGNLMLQSLALTQADGQANPHFAAPFSPDMALAAKERLDDREEEEGQPGKPGSFPHLTNGLAAQAFGDRVAGRAEAMQPMWNEPLRRDLLPTFGAPNLAFREPGGTSIDPAEVPLADALYGQVTLVAPPLQVSPELGQGAGMGLTFDWRDMAKGAGAVDYPGLVTLAKTLPEGSKMLYPAMDPRQLRGGAVNLRLDPRLAEGLVGMGYGAQGKVDAWKSARMAADWNGGTPPIRLLPATMSPLNRPGRRRAGMSPDGLPQGGMGRPAEDASRRMRFIDFLGLPIYLSPTLSTTPDLEQETRARISAEFMPRAPLISPLSFANLRSQLLGGFYGVEAKPELGVWRRAAPDYEKAGSALSGLLSNRLRMGAMGDGMTSPSAPIPRSAALPTVGPMARSMGPVALPALTGAAAGARSPLRPSPFAPPAMPSPSIGSPPQGEVPKFIRYQPKAAAAPTSFRQSIPASSQASTAPASQGATAPKGADPMSPVRIQPQVTIAPEKTTPPAKSLPAKQSPPSRAPASQPAPMEGPKPARPAMVPQSTAPKAAAPPSQAKPKPMDRKPEPMPGLDQENGHRSSLKPPQMLVAPHKPVAGPSTQQEPVVVQTSPSGSGPGGVSNESGASRSAEVGEKKEAGLPGSEINLLANEVWILLKRKLAFEAQRMGK